MKKQLELLMERLGKAPVNAIGKVSSAAEIAVLAEIRTLRERIAHLTGSLVASADGLLIAHDLPPAIEPGGMAALTTSQLSLSHRLALTAHGGAFHEVVIRGTEGYVIINSAGPTASLTVLTGPGVNVGRLHLEARPVARRIAHHLAEGAPDRN